MPETRSCKGKARRILVLGCPGAGKSTFADWLGAETGLPVHHLDDLYWGPGWTRPTVEVWQRRLTDLVNADRWIIDGNYLPTIPLRARRAQLIVVLDAAMLTCLVRVLARVRRIRAGRYDGLPAHVRAEAEAGRSVRATTDFLPLLRTIVRFNRRDWQRVVEHAVVGAGAPPVIAVVPSWYRSRIRLVRRRLQRSAIRSHVYPISVARQLVRDRAVAVSPTRDRIATCSPTEGGNGT